MLSYLKTRRGLVLAAMTAAAVALGVGYEAHARASEGEGCCYPGAACCHPGAACCKAHGGAAKAKPGE